MRDIPPSIQSMPAARNCCHHASPDDLTRFIHAEEACFGTEKRFACANINCQWGAECRDAAPIWLS